MKTRQWISWPKVARIGGQVLSVIVILACLAGGAGSWWLRGQVVNLADRTNEFARSGSDLARAGIGRADGLVLEAREEVGQVENRIQSAIANVDGQQIAMQLARRELKQALEPRIEKLQEELGPIRDAVTVASGFVDVLVSVESVRGRAPWLEDAQLTFDRLEKLGDQLRRLAEDLEVREMEEEGESAEPAEPAGAVNGMVAEVDGRLGEIGSLFDELGNRVDRLETDVREFTSRVTWIAKLSAILLIGVLAWVIYSQSIMLRRLACARQRVV